MNNEIKVGDTVRVSEDAQKIYAYGLNPLWFTEESTVVGTRSDGVIIKLDANNYMTTGLPIPTKYLVKVGAEKEAKYKVGDKVRVRLEFENVARRGEISTVIEVCENNTVFVGFNDYYVGGHLYNVRFLEPYTEPTEQTEAEEDARIRQMEAELDECRKTELDKMLHPEKYCTYEVEVNPNFINWTSYEADLAHDLAVQMVKCNRNNYDKIGNMAVRVAKSVVENLKKK